MGPTTAGQLSRRLGIAASKIETALLALESDGIVLRGEFTAPRGEEVEWCDRVLLSRIHRLTLGRMRKEIEPVSAADFIKFLFAWQHVAAKTQLRGRDGVLEVIRQLQGIELPAPAWEQHVLPARIKDYDPSDLEDLCLAGVIAWGRLRLNDDLQQSDDARRDTQATKAQAARAHPHGADRIFATRRVGIFSRRYRSGVGGGGGSISHGPRSGPVSGTTGRVLSLRYRPRHRAIESQSRRGLVAARGTRFRYRRRDCWTSSFADARDEKKGPAPPPARHQRRPRGGKNDAGGTLVTMARAYKRHSRSKAKR